MPYVLAAAFFVPDWRVRMGTLVVLVCGVGYGVFVGPALAEQRQEEAEIARYRQNPELLYLGDSPRGMEISRVRVGPNLFSVDYTPIRAGHDLGYVGFWVNRSSTPALQCPDPVQKEVTCTVDTHGEMRTVISFPGGRGVTLGSRPAEWCNGEHHYCPLGTNAVVTGGTLPKWNVILYTTWRDTTHPRTPPRRRGSHGH
ncbi:hypothetical protein ACFW2Y_34735 [Streptomyces sp. NPDC058877]|uniref:hypothetical protein n=1 Tax=Streptomyces sp. NPDC058877 TaxID=3346665 RepID=UPI003690F689